MITETTVQKEILVGLLAFVIYPIVLLSNYLCYRHFPEERWPMVLLATLTWWGPITGLGWLLWDIPVWFAGAQSLCLVSAFFATMSLKFLWYRGAVLKKGGSPQLILWQREMLHDAKYSLDRQALHIDAILKDRREMDSLLHRMKERQATLDQSLRQTELYRQISQQTLDDFMGGIASCYLARKQKVEASNVKSDHDGEDSV